MLIVNPINMPLNLCYKKLKQTFGGGPPAGLLGLYSPDAIPADTNRTPYLHHACYKNHFSVVQGLLQWGASLFLRTHYGNSVLIYACCGKEDSRADMIAWLLLHHEDARSTVNWCNNSGSTPLHIASSKGFTKGVIVLLNHGADTTLKDYWRRTAPLCIMSGASGAKEIVEVIESAKKIISAGEWRPKNADMFPIVYRDAMRTLVCLAKVNW